MRNFYLCVCAGAVASAALATGLATVLVPADPPERVEDAPAFRQLERDNADLRERLDRAGRDQVRLVLQLGEVVAERDRLRRENCSLWMDAVRVRTHPFDGPFAPVPDEELIPVQHVPVTPAP